jgi:hypothetical protein
MSGKIQADDSFLALLFNCPESHDPDWWDKQSDKHISSTFGLYWNEQVNVSNTYRVAPRPLPTTELGRFGHSSWFPQTLPLELIYIIFWYLEVRSLVRLRQVSPAAKMAVESMPAYRDIRPFAELLPLNSLWSVLNSSVAFIHHVIKNQTCCKCAAYGDGIYCSSEEDLYYRRSDGPTMARYCHDCWSKV